MQESQENPYAVPLTEVAAPPIPGSDEAIRNAHLAHEASAKSIGFLYLLGFIGMILPLVVALSDGVFLGWEILITTMIALTLLATGIGLRRLRPWARIAGAVLAIPGLLAIPLGTLVSLYILWILLSKKGRLIFSAEYAHIIAATPHLRYRTSIVVKVLLGILLAAMLVIFGFLAWSMHSQP